MMKSKLFIMVALMLAMVGSHRVLAEDVVVIVNPNIKGSMSRHEVAQIFLGKSTQFPSGEMAKPLDIDPADPNYERFAREVLRKSPEQLRAYWAKQVFTGRGSPPEAGKNDEVLRALVAEDRRYLSYISDDKKDASVRVVFGIIE